MGKRKDRIRKFRVCGHKHKKNKTSVAYRKSLKRVKARKIRQDNLLNNYFHIQQTESQ